LRIATFSAALSRDGPGLLLRDILSGDDPQVAASLAVIAAVDPDILLLTEIDYDHGGAALSALAARLQAQGHSYPHQLALRPNTGMASRHDMDADGRLGEPEDAQGYGRFAGDGGMALLSRRPIGVVRDLSDLLWADLPGATLPKGPDGGPFPSQAAQAEQRLSSTGHWVVELQGGPTLLAFAATPPVFDGPEDRNGLRNADEIRLWQVLLGGGLGAVPEGPVVVMGRANLDPVDGEGRHEVMGDLLVHPRLQDPAQRSAGGAAAADPDHLGDPGLDTADWRDGAPGNLRVDYVLPDAALTVTGAGVFWPAPDDPRFALLGEGGLGAGPHRLVWVDVAW